MKRLSRNFLSITLSDLARRLVGFFAVAYLARTIGTSGFGIVNIGFTVLAYAMLASSAGLGTFGTREIARGGSADVVGSIVGIRLFFALPVFATIWIVASLVVHDPGTAHVIILCSASIFAGAAMLDWYFLGKEEMAVVGIGRGISAVLYLLLLFALVRSPGDLIWVAVAAVAGDVGATLFLVAVYRRRVGPIRLHIEPGASRNIVGRSLLLSGGAILAYLSTNLPTLILGALKTNSEVGLFSAASKLVVVLLAIDRVLGALLLPAASRISAESPDRLATRLDLAMKWIVVTALPLTVGGMMLSGKLVTAVYGAQFADAAPVFRILIWFFFCTMIHTVLAAGLLALGQERLYTKSMGISALLYASTVVLLSSIFGIVGTAVAVAASELVTVILMQYQFARFVKLQTGVHIMKALPAVVVMGFGVYCMGSLSWMIAVVAGAVLYGGTLLLTRALTRTDIESLLERI